VRFWDSSALVALLVPEADTASLADLARGDPALAVWWATPVECTSAIARLEREGDLGPADVRAALQRLKRAALEWIEVPPTAAVRDRALRLLRVHALRAADALQLAAAIVAADSAPANLPVVTLDDRLRGAAEREGFTVIPS
jgi:predicted nucleic acid-binding protein